MVRKKLRIEWSMVAAIFSLGWPTMLQELIQTAVQYIDTAMVGMLGTDATAAVGSTTTVNWLVGSSISALGIGFLSFIARSIGAGKNKSDAKSSLIPWFVGAFVCALYATIGPAVIGMIMGGGSGGVFDI